MSILTKKSILVTGGTGSIGTALVKKAIKTKRTVTVEVDNISQVKKILGLKLNTVKGITRHL